MKYVVFTTKNHDGFAMFDTKLSDYRITAPRTTPGQSEGALGTGAPYPVRVGTKRLLIAHPEDLSV